MNVKLSARKYHIYKVEVSLLNLKEFSIEFYNLKDKNGKLRPSCNHFEGRSILISLPRDVLSLCSPT